MDRRIEFILKFKLRIRALNLLCIKPLTSVKSDVLLSKLRTDVKAEN
jgi:hypothetical protein